jgi:uncharacterized protein (DUF2252 family)
MNVVCDVVERIRSFNQGRDPERLRMKYQRMLANSFAFFRGTCHLFYEDWPAGSPLNSAPPVWSCGDLHLENFGSYKGNNRLAYFDINDFDEATLAPCTWDLARFLASIFVAARTLKLSESEALALGFCCLKAYSTALSQGSARMVEAETAEGMVKDLLESLKQRKRQEFLDKRTHKTGGRRRLIIDGKHTSVITMEERSKIESFLKTWVPQQSEPEFFELLDVAHRIAGTGSLGVDRYVLLVEGKGSPDYNYLLDLKEARRSCLQPYLALSQPHWTTEAERIVAIQQRIQGTSPALLFPVIIDKTAYVLRELQPSEDRVDLDNWQGKLRRLDKVIQTMAEVVAWGQLRSTERQGSAIADDLIGFAGAVEWRDSLLRYGKVYADQVETGYQEFCLRVAP